MQSITRGIAGIGLLWLTGANAFALSGTVKDPTGAPIPGAAVFLASDSSARISTNADGEFTIGKPVSIGGGKSLLASGRGLAGIGIKGASLSLVLPASVAGGSLTLYTLRGKKGLELALGPLEAGARLVDLPDLPAGVYTLRVDLGPFTGSAHLIHSGHRMTLLRRPSVDQDAHAGTLGVSALSRVVAVDTLRVSKAGYAPARFPVTSFDQTGISITMQPEAGAVSTLPPVSDYSAAGPFNTVVESNVGPGGAYTVVRPEPLGKDGFLHSPIIYGYGINGEIRYALDFLRPLASHGFVIIGCNKLTGGPGSAANNTAMTNGLNWLLQQNSASGSKFQGKLAVTRAASMGYSVGGTAAVDIGGHEAIKTVVSIHGHVSKAVLHGTLLQTTGTRDNIGLPMQQQTFANSKVPTFLGTVTNADHSYPGKDGGVQRPAILAWLRLWLHNDSGARRYFYGNDCVLCKAPWENPQRKNWQ